MLSAACSVQSGTEAEIGSEDVATTQQPLLLADGFGVTWTKVGSPGGMNYLASCSPNVLVAQNDDGSIWTNSSGGIDSGWSWQSNRSTASAGIGCESVTSLYVMNSAAPKNMYRSYNWGFGGWTFMDAPSGAQRIGSGGDKIWVINTNKDIYSGTSPYNGAWSGWTYRGPGTHGTDADRITGGKAALSSNYRVFTLNEYTALWYNDKLLTSSSTANWKSFPTGGRSYDEIAAVSSTKLFALTTSRDLWRADVTEESCFDNIDNDNDGSKDGVDPDCKPEYAAAVCDNFGTGKWCIGRVTSAPTSSTLVTCSGTTVSSTATGDICTETAANNGTDYLTVIK